MPNAITNRPIMFSGTCTQLRCRFESGIRDRCNQTFAYNCPLGATSAINQPFLYIRRGWKCCENRDAAGPLEKDTCIALCRDHSKQWGHIAITSRPFLHRPHFSELLWQKAAPESPSVYHLSFITYNIYIVPVFVCRQYTVRLEVSSVSTLRNF